MHVSSSVFGAAGLLSNSESLLITNCATRFIYGEQKRHLMMLRQWLYDEVYAANSVTFRANISKTRIM